MAGLHIRSREVFEKYLRKELSEEEIKEVIGHLRVCDECFINMTKTSIDMMTKEGGIEKKVDEIKQPSTPFIPCSSYNPKNIEEVVLDTIEGKDPRELKKKHQHIYNCEWCTEKTLDKLFNYNMIISFYKNHPYIVAHKKIRKIIERFHKAVHIRGIMICRKNKYVIDFFTFSKNYKLGLCIGGGCHWRLTVDDFHAEVDMEDVYYGDEPMGSEWVIRVTYGEDIVEKLDRKDLEGLEKHGIKIVYLEGNEKNAIDFLKKGAFKRSLLELKEGELTKEDIITKTVAMAALGRYEEAMNELRKYEEKFTKEELAVLYTAFTGEKVEGFPEERIEGMNDILHALRDTTVLVEK